MKPRTKLLLMGGIVLALLAGTIKKTQAELFDIANINKALINKTPDQKDSIPANQKRQKVVVAETSDDDWDTEEEDLDAYLAESQKEESKLDKENAKKKNENAALDEETVQTKEKLKERKKYLAQLEKTKGDKPSSKTISREKAGGGK